MQAWPVQALLALVLLVLVLALPAQAPRAWELPVQGLLVLELRAQALRQVRELLVWVLPVLVLPVQALQA